MSAFRRLRAAAIRFCLLATLSIGAIAIPTVALGQDPSSELPSSKLSSSEFSSSSEELASSSSSEPSSSAMSSAEEVTTPVVTWDLALPIFLLTFGVAAGAIGMFMWVFYRARVTPKPPASDEESVKQTTKTIAKAISAFAVAGVLIVLWMSIGLVTEEATVFTVLGGGLIAAAAAAALGAVAGFVFGIPRTREAADQLTEPGGTGTPERSKKAVLLANTNLERISDWLTTLVIGATLVQLKDIPAWLKGIGDMFKDGPTIENLIPFVLVYFFGLAFLGIYLITRLYLTTALKRALGALDGSDHGATVDTAGARAQLDAALKSGDHAMMLNAVLYFDRSGIKRDQTADPALSVLLARVLSSLLKAAKADDATVRKQELKTIVATAARDSASKELLKGFVKAGETTGDEAVDKEILALLGG